MSGEIKSGCNLMNKFIVSTDRVFSKYIDYIDRDDATRNENYHKYSSYVDYVGNPEKTSDLFTATSNHLTENEKAQLKKDFLIAQELENPMWQTVFSFDMKWLAENSIYDEESKFINTEKLTELTRNAMNRILKSEKMEDTAIWSASIHYNTDNVHIHVATTEPCESSRMRREDGQIQGKWKQSSINVGRSTMVNGIINQKEVNQLLTNLRQDIVKHYRESDFTQDANIKQKLYEIYINLPADRKYWTYNSTNLGNRNRKAIDDLTTVYLETYCSDEFEEFKRASKELQEKYEVAYGLNSKQAKEFASNKEKDLYTRVGNAILREMKYLDNEISKEDWLKLHGEYSKMNMSSVNSASSDFSVLQSFNKAMSNMNRAIKKFINKDIQSMKNQSVYQQLEQKAELQRKGYDVSDML